MGARDINGVALNGAACRGPTDELAGVTIEARGLQRR
jgi:hypothetical protein